MSHPGGSDEQGKRKMSRILFVNNSADIYGASRRLLGFVQLLDWTRFEPIVLLPDHGPLENELRAARVRVIIFPELSVIDRKLVSRKGQEVFLRTAGLLKTRGVRAKWLGEKIVGVYDECLANL